MDSTSLRAFDELSAATGQALWPATVTLGGSTYPATIVRARQGGVLDTFSDNPESITQTIRILKVDLAAAPAENSILTWETKTWKIRSIRGQEDTEAQWTLTCEPSP